MKTNKALVKKQQIILASLLSLVLSCTDGDDSSSSSNSSLSGSAGNSNNGHSAQGSYSGSSYADDHDIDSSPVHTDSSAFSPPPRHKGLPGQSKTGRAKYSPLINRVSKRYSVDPVLVHAIISQESQYRPRPSPAGAQGLMQVMPDTGRRFGCNNVLNTTCNVNAGVKYLKYLIKKFQGRGNIQTIAAGYNAGGGVAESYLKGTVLKGKNPKGRKTKYGVPVASFGLGNKSCPGRNYNPSPRCEGETYKYARHVAGFYLRYKRNPRILNLHGDTTRSSSLRCARGEHC